VWLILAAAIQLRGYAEARVVALFCFLVPNSFGLILFLNRNRVAPYPATQWLIGVIGVVAVIFLVYLNRSGLVQEIDPRLGYGQWGFYLLPALFGGLITLFHIMERNAVRRRSEMPD
jgi:4-amino-4-deoxy-L-arabinose transferase-like glycosyltransferase